MDHIENWLYSKHVIHYKYSHYYYYYLYLMLHITMPEMKKVCSVLFCIVHAYFQYFDNKDSQLELTLVSTDQILIHHGRKQLVNTKFLIPNRKVGMAFLFLSISQSVQAHNMEYM